MVVACSSIWSHVLDLVAIFVSAVLSGSASLVKHQLSVDTEPTVGLLTPAEAIVQYFL